MTIPLPEKLKQLIRKQIDKRLFKGRQFIDNVFNVDNSFELIKNHNIKLLSAVDIGANVGQWAGNFKRHFPETHLLSIEANPENLPSLLSVNPDSIQACLANMSGEIREFYLPNPSVERINTGASLYREVLPGYKDPIRLQLKTTTLDTLERQFDLIKLDVQGQCNLEVIVYNP